MSGIFSAIWPVLSSYRPNAARDRQSVFLAPAACNPKLTGFRTNKQPLRFGAFEATYRPPGWGVVRPRNDVEAQRLYNHVRTVAFWLDAAPLLTDLGLPFRAGLDDIISLVPVYGDIVSGILQLYQVWLSFVFGVPLNILGYMVLNVILDVLVGLVPLLGDFLDNLFKSNLRNLALLEKWLIDSPVASRRYHILLMPESNEFLPKPKRESSWASGWFGSRATPDESRQWERKTGKVKQTRRMRRDEGEGEMGRHGLGAEADPVL